MQAIVSPILPTTLKFLSSLSRNNNREWFNTHKEDYLAAHNNMTQWVDALITLMNMHDDISNESGKKSVYRIYNDVRFSKDKSPYNPRFAFSLRRATNKLRGGYYLQIRPGKSYLACGFFAPNPSDLKLIRDDIEHNYSDWNQLLKTKGILSNYGNLQGNKVPTTPRGYEKTLPGIELIRHKQFYFEHPFTDKEVLDPLFLKKVNTLFKSIRPYFDYMSELLTTDANGESIV